MTVAAVYVERACAGGVIVALRFVDLRRAARWAAPSPARAAAEPTEVIKQGAAWVAEQVRTSPGNPELTLVLDADGSACQWITAPSGDERAVRAAVRDALHTGDDDEGGINLGWMNTTDEPAAPGVDMSVQGLGDVAVAEATRRRVALVAVNDLPVRVLQDELDRLGVVVHRVCGLWHAMALAWDAPGATDRVAREVAAEQSLAGVVLIDRTDLDGARLVWAWSERGTLRAGGQTRLAVVTPASEAGTSLRLAGDAGAGGEEPPEVLVNRADLGRVTADWLSFSVQLGLSPARVACVGPRDVSCDGAEVGMPGLHGLAAVGAGLGRMWHGATVVAVAEEDPIGRTLSRLVDVENNAEAGVSKGVAAVDPRLSVTELSSRPGAADRSMHRWMALALLAIGAAIALVGWRLGRNVGALHARLDEVGEAREKLIDGIKGAVPAAAGHETPALVIKSKRLELEKAAKELTAEEPVLAEAARLTRVFDGIPELQLKSLSLRATPGLICSVDLQLPAEGDQGPTIKDRLLTERSAAPRQVKWDGRTSSSGDKRTFRMAGMFEDRPKTVPVVTPPAPSPEATKPDDKHAEPKPEAPTGEPVKEPAKEPSPPQRTGGSR